MEKVGDLFAGSLQIGLTTMAISDSTPVSLLPNWLCDLKSKATWYVTRSESHKSGITVKENYCPSLERLCVNDLVGVLHKSDGTMHIVVNGEDMGVAATNIPRVRHG